MELRSRRRRLRLTQAALGAALGVTANTVARWERGELAIRAPGLVQLALSRLEHPQRRAATRRGALERVAPGRPFPVPFTPFVGRGPDVARLRALLLEPGTRLVTLTGAPGIGKTRLALQVAAALEPAAGGKHFVELAPLAEVELVVPAIAQAIGVRDAGGGRLLDAVKGVLGRGRPLLLLDNFEHLIAEAPLVADLLAACPGLTVLVTSRAALHLSGEQEFRLAPLSFPDRADGEETSALLAYEAVALFEDRARAITPGFAVDAGNATAVAAICHRLEGLPLAIEMAAARTRVLPPRALAERLGSCLDLLRLEARDRPLRQQTLRAALDWSHSLLRPAEQRLFARLAVFAGGFTLDAVEAVCLPDVANSAGPALDALTGIEALVDQSLVQLDERSEGEPRPAPLPGSPAARAQPGWGPRFRMLETVREYARERLAAGGEEEAAWRRYATYVADLADDAERAIHGPEQVTWLRRLDAESGNLRGALSWAHSSGDVELQLCLAGALWEYWWVHTATTEALWWLERAVAAGGAPGPARARALHGAGVAATLQGAFDRAARYFVESVALWRSLGDTAGLARALSYQSTLPWVQGDDGGAEALLREALPLWQSIGDARGSGYALHALGLVAWTSGDNARAAATCEDALRCFQLIGDLRGMAFATVQLCFIRLSEGQAEVSQAEALARQGLALFREWHDPLGYLEVLLGLASAAMAKGDAERAARLLGAADSVHHTTGMVVIPVLQQAKNGAEGAARSALGEAAFAVEYEAGRAMPLEQALDYALSPAMSSPAATTEPRGETHGSLLTPREREVAVLLARGWTNRQIARELIITEGTADRHVSNILGKLGVSSRAGAAVWATEHGLTPAAVEDRA